MRFLKLLSGLTLLLSLVGCASLNISQEERAALKRVSIQVTDNTEKPLVFGPKAGGAFLFLGPVGLAIEQGTSDLPTAYKQFLEQNGIKLSALLKSELESQLVSKGIDVVDNAAQADAIMTVRYGYGLTGDVFSSDDRFPLLVAHINLIKRNGELIWKGYGAANVSKEIVKQVEARPIQEYLSDPKFTDRQIRKVNNILVGEILQSL